MAQTPVTVATMSNKRADEYGSGLEYLRDLVPGSLPRSITDCLKNDVELNHHLPAALLTARPVRQLEFARNIRPGDHTSYGTRHLWANIGALLVYATGIEMTQLCRENDAARHCQKKFFKSVVPDNRLNYGAKWKDSKKTACANHQYDTEWSRCVPRGEMVRPGGQDTVPQAPPAPMTVGSQPGALQPQSTQPAGLNNVVQAAASMPADSQSPGTQPDGQDTVVSASVPMAAYSQPPGMQQYDGQRIPHHQTSGRGALGRGNHCGTPRRGSSRYNTSGRSASQGSTASRITPSRSDHRQSGSGRGKWHEPADVQERLAQAVASSNPGPGDTGLHATAAQAPYYQAPYHAPLTDHNPSSGYSSSQAAASPALGYEDTGLQAPAAQTPCYQAPSNMPPTENTPVQPTTSLTHSLHQGGPGSFLQTHMDQPQNWSQDSPQSPAVPQLPRSSGNDNPSFDAGDVESQLLAELTEWNRNYELLEEITQFNNQGGQHSSESVPGHMDDISSGFHQTFAAQAAPFPQPARQSDTLQQPFTPWGLPQPPVFQPTSSDLVYFKLPPRQQAPQRGSTDHAESKD